MDAESESSIYYSSQQYVEVFAPDNIFVKKELQSDRNSGNQVSSGRLGSTNDSISFSKPFCVLCLRECTSDVVVRFSSQPERHHIDVTDARRKLEQVLDLSVALDDSSVVCRACWKLVDIVGDFRESCLKSARWIERFSRGLRYEVESDRWFSRYLFSSMETVHKAIQDNRTRIDTKETVALNPPESKVPSTGQKKPTMKEETEFGFEDAVVEDDVDTSAGTKSSKPANVALALLGDDNYNPLIEACEKCGRKFDGVSALRVHAERCVNETGGKLYTCSICNVSFKELSGLRFHMNKHNGVKPYKCRKFCDRTFYSNYVRIKHERRICQLDGRICPTCGTLLKNELSLIKHIEAVHGEAKHNCAKCSKVFKTSRALRSHQSAHSDERKYSCPVCGKGYKSMYAAKVHMRTHTQERPYACHLCDQTFNYKVSMKSHIERYHGQT